MDAVSEAAPPERRTRSLALVRLAVNLGQTVGPSAGGLLAALDYRWLFVADGGPFVSQADKNPTWTILALSMRTSRHIVAERKAGRL